MTGITPDALNEAHQADLDIQGEEGVNFKQAWAGPCVWDGVLPFGGPNAGAVQRIHERAGHPADKIYEFQFKPDVDR